MTKYSKSLMSVLLISALFSVASVAPLWPQQSGSSTDGNPVTVEKVQSELSEAFAAISAYSVQERQEALDAARSSLERIDHEIDLLEHRARENWHGMTDAAQENTSQAMRTLRERRNRIGEIYGAMSHGTQAAWGELIYGFSRAWEELKTAWTEAAAEADSSS